MDSDHGGNRRAVQLEDKTARVHDERHASCLLWKKKSVICTALLTGATYSGNESSTEKACTRRTATLGTRSIPSVPFSCIASQGSHDVVLAASWVAGATRSHNLHGALVSRSIVLRVKKTNSLHRVSVGSRGFVLWGTRPHAALALWSRGVLGPPCTSPASQLLWYLS